jgi:hypothetical protein
MAELSVSVQYRDGAGQIVAYLNDTDHSEYASLPDECIAQFSLVHRANKLLVSIRPRSKLEFRFTKAENLPEPHEGQWDLYSENDDLKQTFLLASFPKPATWQELKTKILSANDRLSKRLRSGEQDASDDEEQADRIRKKR